MRRAVLGALGATVLIAGLAVAGYAIGSSSAPNASDARAARQVAYQAAYRSALGQARDRSRAKAREQGLTRGRAQGRRADSDAGRAKGQAAAQAQLAEAQQRAIAAQQAAAQAEAAQRDANCGAPLFVEGYCPTDAEVARESAAESLCGPGTPEGRAEAARQGITC